LPVPGRYQSNLRAAVLCGLQLLLVCFGALRLCDRHNFSLHSLTHFAISAQTSARFPRCSLLDQAKLYKIPPKFTEILIRHPTRSAEPVKRRLRREWPWLRSFEHLATLCLNARQNEYQGHFRGGNRCWRRFAGIRRWSSPAEPRIFRAIPSTLICERMRASAASGNALFIAAWTPGGARRFRSCEQTLRFSG
jgi:hypothetical protein